MAEILTSLFIFVLMGAGSALFAFLLMVLLVLLLLARFK